MSNDIIKGYWNEVKGKVKQQWGKLTDDDVTQMEGTYDELVGKLQKSYGYEKVKAQQEIDNFILQHGLRDKNTSDTV
jgi:uncharacterized protein YjbJ (UPF0337 family)